MENQFQQDSRDPSIDQSLGSFSSNQNALIKDKKSIDEVYKIMGNGSYQFRIVVIFSIMNMLWSIYFMTPAMFFQMPQFICNGNLCNQSDYCKLPDNQRSISENSKGTITYDFKLYCGKETINSIGESLPFLGAIVGLLFLMVLSDNKGRKFTITLGWLICSVGGILTVAFDNVVTLFMGLFIVGFGMIPAGVLGIVYLNETTTGKFRSVSVCLMYVAFGLAELLIWPLSEITSNWRSFNLYFLTIPYISLNFIYFVLYESPKFMINKNMGNTVNILNKIMETNKKNYRVDIDELQKVDSTTASDKAYSYIDLFRYKSIRTISLCMITLSFGIHALYYGIQFSLDLIGSNVAKNTFYVGLADFFGYLLSDIACPKLPRKRWLIITLFLTSIFCFSFAIDPVPKDCVPDGQSCPQKTWNIVQAVAARFVVSFSFSFMIIWMNELFPTTIRSSGLGLQLLVGLGGAYIIPYIKQISISIGLNFVFSLGFFGIIGCGVSFFIKETLNQPILDEIPELTKFHQHDLDNDNNNNVSSINDNENDIDQLNSNNNYSTTDTENNKIKVKDFNRNLEKSNESVTY